MDNLSKILVFLNKAEKLKTIRRQVSISDNSRKESPAEHSWRVALMGMILHRELNLKIDLLKALEIILVHDIVEAVAGDVWILDKNDKDAHSNQQKKELQAAEELYATLPNETGAVLQKLWLEYENQTSEEAKFAKALDKMEVIIQRCDLGTKNWERNDIYPILLHWADDPVHNFPELKVFWEKVQAELSDQQQEAYS
jgi:putative hydrolase of HD superfamily